MAHPPRRWPPRAVASLKKLRAVLTTLDGASEKEAWAAPTFRVAGRMFAMFVCDHHGDGRLALWLNAHPEMQRAVVADDPKHFFVPPYVGPKGWVGMRLDGRLPWRRVEELFRGAYRFTRAFFVHDYALEASRARAAARSGISLRTTAGRSRRRARSRS